MNSHSATWFETFLRTYWPSETARELDSVARCLPQPEFHTIFDVCCGPGRYALPLAARGYRVTGVDRDTPIARPPSPSSRALRTLCVPAATSCR
jgi:SAM-dependent methyltransferase